MSCLNERCVPTFQVINVLRFGEELRVLILNGVLAQKIAVKLVDES